MKRVGRKAFLAIWGAAAVGQQPPDREREEQPKRLPDGTLQSEAILKAEHKRMLSDVSSIVDLCKEIETELEKNQHHVLSLGMIKKLDEIEKIAKRMRSRIRR